MFHKKNSNKIDTHHLKTHHQSHDVAGTEFSRSLHRSLYPSVRRSISQSVSPSAIGLNVSAGSKVVCFSLFVLLKNISN